MGQEHDDLAARKAKLEDLRRRREELEKRRRAVESVLHPEETSGAPPPTPDPEPTPDAAALISPPLPSGPLALPSGAPPASPIGPPPPRESKAKRPFWPMILAVVAIVIIVVLLSGRQGPPEPDDLAARAAAADSAAQEARRRGDQEMALIQARLDSMAAVADSLHKAAGRADDMEQRLEAIAGSQADLRRQLEEERKHSERESRERERIARELAEQRAAASRPPQAADASEVRDVHAKPTPEKEVIVAPPRREEARIAGLAELDSPPKPDRRVDAGQLARQRNVPIRSGTVMLRVLISDAGAAEDIQVVQSLTPQLDQVAIEAVKGWAFTPPTAGGQPVRVWIRVPVAFR